MDKAKKLSLDLQWNKLNRVNEETNEGSEIFFLRLRIGELTMEDRLQMTGM